MQGNGAAPRAAWRQGVDAVLFDLDGTLIDSAPDLAGAANDMRVHRGLPELPYPQLRPMAGAGARGMVGVAFGVAPGEPEFNGLREEFLNRYEARMLRMTRPYDHVPGTLQALEEAGLPWGIVTNKAARFTLPVLEGLNLLHRAGVVICGDTTPHAKPHPEPLLEAARRLKVNPAKCVYVGDDLRDVQAGLAASMLPLAAAWGYLGQGEAIAQWGALACLTDGKELLNWLGLA